MTDFLFSSGVDMLLNAATVLICLMLILIFRRIDRANVRIEKLKRFADKRLADFKDLTAAENRRFSDATIDMDLLLKKSASLTDSLRQSIGEIESKMKSIESEKGNLRKIEEDLHAVTDAANDLNSQLKYIDGAKKTFDDLGKRSALIADSLAKIEKDQSALISSFGDRVRAKAHDLEKELSDELDRIRHSAEQKENRIADDARGRSDSLVRSFSETLARLETQAGETADTILDTVHERVESIERGVSALETRIVTIEKTESDIDRLYERVRGIEDSISESRSKLIASFDDEQNRLRSTMDQLTLHAISKKDEIISAVRREMEDMHSQIEGFDSRYADMQKKMLTIAEDRTASITSDFDSLERRFDTLSLKVTETENGINHAIDTHVEDVRAELRTMDLRFASTKTELTNSLDSSLGVLREEFSRMEDRLATIRREIVSYEETHRVFTRTDEVLAAISEAESRAEILHEFLNNVDDFREAKRQVEKDLKHFQAKQSALSEIEGEIHGLLSLAESVKNRTDTLELNSVKIEKVDQKIQAMSSAYTNLEKRIRELNDYGDLIQQNLESINRIDSIINGFESRVNSFEQGIDKTESRAVKLTEYLAKVESATITLKAREQEIRNVSERFSELDSLSEHLEERMKQITVMLGRVEGMRSEVEMTDSHLQDVASEANKKIKQLADIIQSSPAESSGHSISKQMKGNAITKGVNDAMVKMVRDLSTKGWSSTDISRSMMLEENTVRLIINTSSQDR